jgi:hypothetical protein
MDLGCWLSLWLKMLASALLAAHHLGLMMSLFLLYLGLKSRQIELL